MQRPNPFFPSFPCFLAHALLLVVMSAGAVHANQVQQSEWNQQTEWPIEDDAEHTEFARRLRGSAGFGLDFSRGDYGEPDPTNVGSASIFAKLEYEPITFKLLVPYVVIDGSDDVIIGENGRGNSGSSDLRYGVGDLVTTLVYSWFPERSYVSIVDLSTKVKIPTASEKENIGTGEVDVTVQLEVTKTIANASFFAGGGYRLKGGFYRDIWLASLGSSFRLGRRASIGVAYDFRQGSTSPVRDSHEISPFASFRLGSQVRFSPYVVIGLSENSPDWGTGATFSVGF